MSGKRIKALRAEIEKEKIYDIDSALALVKKNANAKFLESVEVAINLGVDARKSDQVVRGTAALPNGTGKEVRVAVFARDAKAEEAKSAGADIVGTDDLMEQIQQGQIDFDRCIATPDMMGVVGRVAKILGPKGLMPNPKLGTVTPNVSDAVKLAKAGEIQFRMDKAAIVHAAIGKVTFSEQELKDNLTTLVAAVEKAKPAAAKGTYIKKASLSSTMGPGVKLDINVIAA